MKTRILMIVTLTVAALTLLLGLKIGRKNAETEVGDSAAADSLVAKRVFNLIILDESGSMSGLEDASITGVNETLKTIRAAYEEFPEQEQFVTFATFSGEPYYEKNTCRVKREQLPIASVTDLTRSEYHPNGMTPLWDSMGKLLTELDDQVEKEDLVLVTIITDGYENSSVRYDADKIKKLVTRLDEKGWVFTYIGANQDASQAAGEMGIKNFLEYTSDKAGTRNMYERENRMRSRFYQNSRLGTQRERLQQGYFNEDVNK